MDSMPMYLVVGALCSLMTLWNSCTASDQGVVFPPNSGVIDITKPPYNADNTGATDVSEILSRALNLERATDTWLSKIVYLPNGTYLVKSTVRQKEPPNTIGPHLQGQSRAATIIKLADGTWPTPSEKLNFVLSTGNGVAQCFNRGVRNLTVDIGSNNAGASGIWWYGNNAALMSDVDVVSRDGSGMIGVHAGDRESGPSMVRNLRVKGFEVGIRLAALNAVTFLNTTLENQGKCGIVNRSHPVWFDSVYSDNKVPVLNNGNNGSVVIVGGHFVGGSDTVDALLNLDGLLFARGIRTSGYRKALYSPATNLPLSEIPSGTGIVEFSSHAPRSLHTSASATLRLPRKLPPEPAWETDAGKWAIISDYQSGRTDAQALQAAIDDPAKTAIALNRELDLDTTVFVRGMTKLILGTVTALRGGNLEIVDCRTPVVKIQNINGSVRIIQKSSRTLILESVLCGVVGDGSGDIFITDFVSGMEVRNPQQHVWAWHFNSEGSGIRQSAGTVRCFGWKTEHHGTKVKSTGGTLEILGFLMYAPCGDKPYPLFQFADTRVSVAMLNQTTYCNGAYNHIIEETRGDSTAHLYANENPLGTTVPLFLGYQ